MLNNQELKRLHRTVNPATNDRLAITFNALSDPNRCKVFRMMVTKGKAGLFVSDVARLLKVSPSAASQNLKVLEITGLLARERQGQRVKYSVRADDPLVASLIQAILKA